MNAAYVQAFIRLNSHISLNPAYLYLQRHTPALEEHGFLPAIILSMPLRAFSIDDRNLYWCRIRRHGDILHVYRNRLRFSYNWHIGFVQVKPYLYGEVFYLISRGRWTRNRIAPGCSIEIAHRFSLDVSFNRELDFYNGRSNLVFLMSTLSLNRHHANK